MVTREATSSSAAASRFYIMATCPKGLEASLAKELTLLGGEAIQESVAAVFFSASLEQMYHILSWSRIANRMVLVLLRQRLDTVEDYSTELANIPWEDYFSIEQSLAVSFQGSNRHFRSQRFGAQVTKDAIQARFNRQQQQKRSEMALVALPRVMVDLENPDVWIHVRAFKNRYVVGLDLVGDSLHKRGYRQITGAAPLKENLAAAILQLVGWTSPSAPHPGHTLEPAASPPERYHFIDPCCGSATLLIEATLIALDVAPSYLREPEDWAHIGLKFFDQLTWRKIREPILQQRSQLQEEGELTVQATQSSNTIKVFGADIDPRSITAAQANINQASLGSYIELKQCDLKQLNLSSVLKAVDNLEESIVVKQLLLTNPPYGNRLGEVERLTGLYESLGDLLYDQCQGWEAGLLTGNPELGWSTGLRSWRQHRLFNGSIECRLQRYRINEAARLKRKQKTVHLSVVKAESPAQYEHEKDVSSREAGLNPNAQMLVNRLEKKLRKLGTLRRNIESAPYRLYDRDLPEYAFILDCYPVFEDVKNNASAKKISLHI